MYNSNDRANNASAVRIHSDGVGHSSASHLGRTLLPLSHVEPGMVEQRRHRGPKRGIAREHDPNERGQLAADGGRHLDVLAQDLVENDIAPVLGVVKREPAACHGKEKYTQAPNVCLLAVKRCLTDELRCGVVDRAAEGAVGNLLLAAADGILLGVMLGESKVEDGAVPRGWVVHEVLQLQVKMYNVETMDHFHRGEDLSHDGSKLRFRNTTRVLDAVVEQFAATDVLHVEAELAGRLLLAQ
mmetsp:Transcript_133163/g.188148  ORF Transcript_133163/g.188148 Transcript_133163/m.188148 type:complete len:242 (+) Transcript_133163:34-759(+)